MPINDREHPAEKPLDLLAALISKSAPKGSVVFDPFTGSASTLIAARQCGCHYLGFELSEEYFNIANTRLELTQADATVQVPSGSLSFSTQESELTLGQTT